MAQRKENGMDIYSLSLTINFPPSFGDSPGFSSQTLLPQSQSDSLGGAGCPPQCLPYHISLATEWTLVRAHSKLVPGLLPGNQRETLIFAEEIGGKSGAILSHLAPQGNSPSKKWNQQGKKQNEETETTSSELLDLLLSKNSPPLDSPDVCQKITQKFLKQFKLGFLSQG